jgi:hypothetical protein
MHSIQVRQSMKDKDLKFNGLSFVRSLNGKIRVN